MEDQTQYRDYESYDEASRDLKQIILTHPGWGEIFGDSTRPGNEENIKIFTKYTDDLVGKEMNHSKVTLRSSAYPTTPQYHFQRYLENRLKEIPEENEAERRKYMEILKIVSNETMRQQMSENTMLKLIAIFWYLYTENKNSMDGMVGKYMGALKYVPMGIGERGDTAKSDKEEQTTIPQSIPQEKTDVHEQSAVMTIEPEDQKDISKKTTEIEKEEDTIERERKIKDQQSLDEKEESFVKKQGVVEIPTEDIDELTDKISGKDESLMTGVKVSKGMPALSLKGSKLELPKIDKFSKSTVPSKVPSQQKIVSRGGYKIREDLSRIAEGQVKETGKRKEKAETEMPEEMPMEAQTQQRGKKVVVRRQGRRRSRTGWAIASAASAITGIATGVASASALVSHDAQTLIMQIIHIIF